MAADTRAASLCSTNPFSTSKPVFLIAEGTNIPQLKRVIVGDGAHLAMEPTLAEGLQVVFGERVAPPEGTTEAAQELCPGAGEALSRADRRSDGATGAPSVLEK